MELISEDEIVSVLQNTIEKFWSLGKHYDQIAWSGAIRLINEHKGWSKQQLEAALLEFCLERSSKAEDKQAEWCPALGVATKYLQKHQLGAKTESDGRALWNLIPSCELCDNNGFVHYIDWLWWEKHKTFRSYTAFCTCKKGTESPYKTEAMQLPTCNDVVKMIENGRKLTIVPKDRCVPCDQKELPSKEEVIKWVETEYNKAMGCPF